MFLNKQKKNKYISLFVTFILFGSMLVLVQDSDEASGFIIVSTELFDQDVFEEGDIIGLLNGDLLTKGSHLEEVAQELLMRMGAKDCDIITLYYGESLSSDDAEGLAQMIRKKYSNPEVEVVDGGQPHYHCIISSE